MLINCPSCGEGFEIPEGAVAVKATHPCPHCQRIVVIRDAHVVPPRGEATVPFEAGGPAPSSSQRAHEDEATRVTGTSLPLGRRVSLAILSGPRQGEIVTLAGPRLLIGRAGGGSGVDLEIGDPEVSPAHAALEYSGGGFVVRDMDSRSGTWVGDERIESRALEDRGEFRVGGTRFMLIIAEA
jgi:hypothetical protein